jgi:hypothetical protein
VFLLARFTYVENIEVGLCYLYLVCISAYHSYQHLNAYNQSSWSLICLLSRLFVSIDGFRLVNRFFDQLQVVTTNKYNTIADFHTTKHSTRNLLILHSLVFTWWELWTTTNPLQCFHKTFPGNRSYQRRFFSFRCPLVNTQQLNQQLRSKRKSTSKKLAVATQRQFPRNIIDIKQATGFQISSRTLRKLMLD